MGCYDVRMTICINKKFTPSGATLLRGSRGASRRVLALLTFAAVLTVAPAYAETASSYGTSVLQCFHPEAKFAGMSFTREHAGANGRHTWKGWIRFREGAREDPVVMSFAIDMKTKDGEILTRITPLADGGSSPPSQSCYLREWQRSYY